MLLFYRMTAAAITTSNEPIRQPISAALPYALGVLFVMFRIVNNTIRFVNTKTHDTCRQSASNSQAICADIYEFRIVNIESSYTIYSRIPYKHVPSQGTCTITARRKN